MNVNPEAVMATLLALVGGGGVWAYLGGKSRNHVDLVQIAQDAAATVIHGLTEEMERLRCRADALEAQDARCRSDLAALREQLGTIQREREP